MCAELQVPKAVNTKLWGVTLCGLVDMYNVSEELNLSIFSVVNSSDSVRGLTFRAPVNTVMKIYIPYKEDYLSQLKDY